jgi:hypothetical protein
MDSTKPYVVGQSAEPREASARVKNAVAIEPPTGAHQMDVACFEEMVLAGRSVGPLAGQ